MKNEFPEVPISGSSMIVAGVDEAGRGPWAGPVVASAVVLPQDYTSLNYPQCFDLRDSKKLSEKKRDRLYSELMLLAQYQKVGIGIGMADVDEIDMMNILQASLLAMRRAIMACTIIPSALLVDGLYLPTMSINELHSLPPQLMQNSRAIVRGDELHACISAASIIAKVTRDRLMIEADQRYPYYGFAKHKGYGTKAHLQALIQHGVCPLHRKSFAPVAALLA